MEPVPEEWDAFEEARRVFDDAYVNVVQAMERIKRIFEIKTVRETVPPKPPIKIHPPPFVTDTSGKVCPRCFSLRILNKGGSCFTCQDCQFDLGCGG